MLEIVCPQPNEIKGIEVANHFETRRITHVFHDIDGTHSLIRDWVPVMALVNGAVARYGMFPGNARQVADEIIKHRNEDFAEARRFAIESAGLSALTQMEWALRMAKRLNNTSTKINETVISLIWQGQERFENFGESADELAIMNQQAAELFKAYEILLLEISRNENLAAAQTDPKAWQVVGSMDFLQFLYQNGVKNYFVTGAVVEYDTDGNAKGTMAEEIKVLNYQTGKGRLIERFCGSEWNKKEPKVEIMRHLCESDNINPKNLLIVGDGRSEISAAKELGTVAISRLGEEASRQKEIHRMIGTNLIVNDYSNIQKLFRLTAESSTI